MAMYPTPPSSSGDSPQPIYFVASPTSNSFSVASPEMNHYVQTHILPMDTANVNNVDVKHAPYLRFIEEPINKFRFRYKSEMAGTHGSLCGMNSDKSRKQTYPTVELVNCPQKAIVRCSIYQYNIEENFKPHPHRLIMKRGREEHDDPHDLQVGPEEGYVATFHSMGIIHTARKNIVSELVKKKSLLKKEHIATIEGQIRELTAKELMEIKTLAEQESKSINLNIVCLRFDAYIETNGIKNQLCPPIYSTGINNLKCALTGDLKIVRMDHCTSPAKGGKEIFLLVERVTKKNIKIRFFELGEDDESEVWEGWGKFTELDVHHQYAIVFKTPAYDRDPNITQPVVVYMELMRPSDNARSEWKEFRYVPNNEFKPGVKRPRPSNYGSSSSCYSSGSLKSNELPTTVRTVAQTTAETSNSFFSPSVANSWNQVELITNEQLHLAMQDVDSDEFKMVYELLQTELPPTIDLGSNATDGYQGITQQFEKMRVAKDAKKIPKLSGGATGKHLAKFLKEQEMENFNETIIKMEVLYEDLKKAERTYTELRSFIKTKDADKRVANVLEHHFANNDPNIRKNNALHVFISLNGKEEVTFFLKMFVLAKRCDLANVVNADQLTPLQIAVLCRNEEFISYLIHCNVDMGKQDPNGRTALHLAVKAKVSPKIFELLLAGENGRKCVDVEDYDGLTPLNYALETANMVAVKFMCHYGANVNKKHQKNGFTPLRIAIENQIAPAVQVILNHSGFRMDLQNDFQNVSPFHAATMKDDNDEIIDLLTKYMSDHGIPLELKKEEEDIDEDSDDEMEEIDCKPDLIPIAKPEEVYRGIKKLTPKCLDEVARILDENEKYLPLAELLDLGHLICAGLISHKGGISKNLLQYAIERDNVSIFVIRNFLENLDETGAVAIMDRMAQEIYYQNALN
ncbi:nuclear factor NF-kappa-B p105 subunit isoform X2 [Anthonomus grandis grandis]|nr:nuclear factor NF-kappa-B p105 subunit isoform X2 [Anthonomus grandis grandis]